MRKEDNKQAYLKQLSHGKPVKLSSGEQPTNVPVSQQEPGIEFENITYTPSTTQKKKEGWSLKKIGLSAFFLLVLYIGITHFPSSNSTKNIESGNVPPTNTTVPTVSANFTTINALSRLRHSENYCDYYLLKRDTWQAIIASLQTISVSSDLIAKSGLNMTNTEPDNGLSIVLPETICTFNNIPKQ